MAILSTSVLENTEKLTNFSFEISSTSNVDWKNIGWQASVTYKDSANVEQTMSVPAHYKTFANALAEGKPYLTTATDTAYGCVSSAYPFGQFHQRSDYFDRQDRGCSCRQEVFQLSRMAS